MLIKLLEDKKSRNFLVIAFFAFITFFPLFYKLNSFHILVWDEGRLAENAIEMAENGNYIVTYFDGKPETWNTKPPLMIWLQVISLKIFGYNQLSIRLPSAISALLTCSLILLFFRAFTGRWVLGIIIVLVLITSEGFVRVHHSRTGDFDALLTLCTTAYCLFLLYYLEKKDQRFIFWAIVFISLATLTKGIAGLFFVPALAICVIFSGSIVPILKSKYFYFGLLFFIITVVGFYLLREHYQNGYLKLVWENELGGRFNSALEGHDGGPNYYYDGLIKTYFKNWYLLIIPGIIIPFFYKNKNLSRILIYVSILAVSFLLIISSAKTKVSWYVMPSIPLLSIICGFIIFLIYDLILNSQYFKSVFRINVTAFCLLIFIFTIPYNSILISNDLKDDFDYNEWQKDITKMLFEEVNGNSSYDTRNHKIVFKNYSSPMLFYVHALNKRDYNLKFYSNIDSIECKDKVIIGDGDSRKQLTSKFECVRLYKFKEADVYYILCNRENVVSFENNLDKFPNKIKDLKKLSPQILEYLNSVVPDFANQKAKLGNQKKLTEGYSSFLELDGTLNDESNYQSRWVNEFSKIERPDEIIKQYGVPDSLMTKKPNVALYLLPAAIWWAEH